MVAKATTSCLKPAGWTFASCGGRAQATEALNLSSQRWLCCTAGLCHLWQVGRMARGRCILLSARLVTAVLPKALCGTTAGLEALKVTVVLPKAVCGTERQVLTP